MTTIIDNSNDIVIVNDQVVISIVGGGGQGIGLPPGGLTGQVATKNSDASYDVSWQTLTGGVVLNPAPATTTISGTIVTLTAGENVAFGDIVYIKSDGKLWKADQSSAGKFPAQYMSTATISANATGVFCRNGIASNASWTWTVGSANPIYLSTTGGMTQTAPSSTGNVIQVLGHALSATLIDFNPSPDYITHV